MPFQGMKVYSRSGEEIHDRWTKEGAPSAYAGMQYHDFPNFCKAKTYLLCAHLLTSVTVTMTGPNTLSGHFSLTMTMYVNYEPTNRNY